MKLLMLYPPRRWVVPRARGKNWLINNSSVSVGFVVKIERDGSFCAGFREIGASSRYSKAVSPERKEIGALLYSAVPRG